MLSVYILYISALEQKKKDDLLFGGDMSGNL